MLVKAETFQKIMALNLSKKITQSVLEILIEDRASDQIRLKNQRDRTARCRNNKKLVKNIVTLPSQLQSQMEVGLISKKKVSKNKKVSKTLLPEDWVPLEDHFAHAARQGLDREFVLAKAKRMRSWSRINDVKRSINGWNETLHDWIDKEFTPKPAKPLTPREEGWNAVYDQLDRIKNGTERSLALGQPAIEILPPSQPALARIGGGYGGAGLSISARGGDEDLFG